MHVNGTLNGPYCVARLSYNNNNDNNNNNSNNTSRAYT